MNVPNNFYAFVIDTDTYAGDFEREMTAFCTGQIGECTVGSQHHENFHATFDEELCEQFEDIIDQRVDDRGCHRPCSIWTTPGWFNDGMGNHWREEHWGTPKVAAKLQKTIDEYEAKHPTANLQRELVKCPAYLSCAIFFSERPDPSLIEFMKHRAKQFTELPPRYEGTPKINITGFRLLHVRTVADELEI